MPGHVVDGVKVIPQFLGICTGQPVGEHFGESYDDVQWRAKLVGHVGEEVGHGPASVFGLLLGGHERACDGGGHQQQHRDVPVLEEILEGMYPLVQEDVIDPAEDEDGESTY